MLANMKRTGVSKDSTRLVFCLLPGYSLLSLAGALETLQFSNEYSNTHSFEWVTCSEDGEPVPDSLGSHFPIDSGLEDLRHGDLIIVCAGKDVQSNCTKPILNWLRRNTRFGVRVGGFNTGTFALAKAGVLKGAKTTIHWRNRASFIEEFPDVELSDYAYTHDRGRYATAGGTTSIDLMLHLISNAAGESIAQAVSGQLNYTNIRVLQDSERVQSVDRIGFRHQKLSVIISLMEKNLEDPIQLSDLAQHVNISTRQLERLFQQYLQSTPKGFYTNLRLQHAQSLLLQTNMSVTSIALICGFSTPTSFSRRFKACFGIRPQQLRGEIKR